MAVSYKKLFKLMIDKDMKKKDLIAKTGLSYATIGKLERGDNVQMEVLEKVCRELKCQLSDIAEVFFDQKTSVDIFLGFYCMASGEGYDI